MSRSFGITWDYRCPFARNAHEHVVTALEAGADWNVEFLPFSLSQVHVEEGDPPVWFDQGKSSTLLGAEVGLVVADQYPEAFNDVHLALFAARHDEARDIRERDVIGDVLKLHHVDPEKVFAEIDGGKPLAQYQATHESLVAEHRVFGVPTFIIGDHAVFVRITTRPQGDGDMATRTIDRVLDLIESADELNEFKYTKISR